MEEYFYKFKYLVLNVSKWFLTTTILHVKINNETSIFYKIILLQSVFRENFGL